MSSSFNNGKTVDRSEAWSEWVRDERGFWYRNQTLADGREIYDYLHDDEDRPEETPRRVNSFYPSHNASSIQASTPRTTPRTEDDSQIFSISTDQCEPSIPRSNSLYTTTNPSFQSATPSLNSEYSTASQNLMSTVPSTSSGFDLRTATPSYLQYTANGLNFQPTSRYSTTYPRTQYASPEVSTQGLEQLSLADSIQDKATSEFETIREPSRFFKVGRVFKTPWAEPAGDISNQEETLVMDSKSGHKVFTKDRHFVVVKEKQGCSICLSLNTFNGQGTLKARIRPDDFAAVYDSRGQPDINFGETLNKEPFPIIVENPTQTIDNMSRLNFGKVYTVEHNTSVLKIGRVADENIPLLEKYFNEAFLGSSTFANNRSAFSYGNVTLDPRYKEMETKNLSKFWRVGRVFMTLWVEPIRGGDLGKLAYSEIRRFVVIGTNWGSARCSPISTYGGQATFKPNLPDVHKHAIIYTSKDPPAEQFYEIANGMRVYEGLTKFPIRVLREQEGPEGDLGALSRVNFSKVYTVEFYARVLNIGMVHNNMVETLVHYASTSRDEPSQGPKHRSSKASRGTHGDSKGASSKKSERMKKK